MGISPGLDAFRLTHEISPIILTGGIAQSFGGALPIIAITETLNFAGGLLSGGGDLGLDDFFAHFYPLPGSTLVDNRFGEYPYANQAVAANARIAQPLIVSLRMVCPVKHEAGYAIKLATITALRAALAQHEGMGGTYTVATPSYFYTNCVLLGLRDTSAGESHQRQNAYQWDFRQPLLALQDAQQAQSGLMSMLTSGVPIVGQPSYSGLATGLATGPASLAMPSGVAPVGVSSGASATAAPFVPASAGPQPAPSVGSFQ